MNVEISKIVEGNNPRRYMDPSELEELTRSVKSMGIIQPIVVKAMDNGEYMVVAGHRRRKAAIAAGLNEMPVFVIENGEDAEAVALAENTVRADMSAAEESDAAVALLNKNKGDMQEVALILGWTESKLRRRVALGACSKKVRDALAERKIKLGVAELLATVPEHKNQDKALVAIIERDMGVEQVRQLLFKLVQKLDKAIFDKTECHDCRFNTGVQKTLFAETVAEDAYCTNGQCYGEKTELAVVAKAESLKNDYATVKIVRLGAGEDWTKLVAEGTSGVGSEQYGKCGGCAHFGATVSALTGSEGEVEESLCFNLPCHEEMVKAEHAPMVVETADEEESGEGECDESGCAGTAQAPRKKADASQKRPKVALSSGMTEYRRKVWKMAAMKSIAKSGELAAPLVVAMIATGHGRDFADDKVSSVCKKGIEGFASASKLNDLHDAAEKITAEKAGSLMAVCAASAVEKLNDSDVCGVLKFLKTDMADHWVINADYLGLMTKTEISAMVANLGLAEKIKDWKKVSGGKKDQMIEGILQSGVELKGLIPDNMAYTNY